MYISPDGPADDVAAEVQMNGPSQPPTVVPDTSPRPTPVREEPEKIKKWREEQAKRLEQKDAEEEEKKAELRATAKKELEEWYARYHEQIEKAKLANRNAEKEWVHERDSPAPKGQEWEAIAKLCDFNPKAARNSKDVSRMRSIILQLKQSPPQTNKTPWGVLQVISLIPFSCKEVLHEMLDYGCELLVEASDTACNSYTWRLVEMLFSVFLFFLLHTLKNL